jgi:hypothetical protein
MNEEVPAKPVKPRRRGNVDALAERGNEGPPPGWIEASPAEIAPALVVAPSASRPPPNSQGRPRQRFVDFPSVKAYRSDHGASPHARERLGRPR